MSKDGSWRDMYFKNGILIGDDVENNNAVNFIMANGGSSYRGKKGKKGNGGSQAIAAQNNFLMLKADGWGRGAHAKGVNQINNAFGYVDVDQSTKHSFKYTDIDVDIYKSFNKSYSSTKSYSSNYSFSKKIDVDIDVYKSSSAYLRR